MNYRQDEVCVLCGRYTGESGTLFCSRCGKQKPTSKRLDKRKGLWYNIVKILKALRKK